METPARTSHEVRLSDLAAAALLVSEGCRLIDVVPADQPGRKDFIVSGDRDRIEDLLSAFARGDAVVSLDAFLAAQGRLKDRLFRSARIGHGAR